MMIKSKGMALTNKSSLKDMPHLLLLPAFLSLLGKNEQEDGVVIK